MTQKLLTTNEEWLKVLDKGLITIPKDWRDALGIIPGGLVKATKQGNKLIVEPVGNYAPIRTFSDEEIAEWLELDKLSPEEAKQFTSKAKKTSRSK